MSGNAYKGGNPTATDIFEGRSIPQAYFKFCLPLVFSMVVSLVYNLADTYFISYTGNTALVAGVSLCAPLITFLMAFGNIYAQGGSSLITRLLGANNIEGVQRVSSFCIYLSIFTGIFVTIVMLLFRTPVLYMMGATSETFDYASQYFTVLVIGSIFNLLTFPFSNFLRAEGCSIESMIASVGGSIVNIVLDPIFISVFGWGAKGAAIATVIGYLFNDGFCLYMILKKSKYLSLRLSQFKVPVNHVSQIFIIGTTAALTNLTQTFAQIMLNKSLLTYGNTQIAAMGIASKVILIVFLILVGFSYGPIPMFGFLYGSGNKEKLKETIRFCFTFLCSLAAVMSILLFIGANFMMTCFLKDAAVISAGTTMIRWQTITLIFAGIIVQTTVLFQSTGKGLGSLILSISRQGFVFIAALFIAKALFGYTGVIASQAVSDVISVIIALALYKKYF